MTTTERRPLDTLNVNDLAVLRRIIGEVIDDGNWFELPPLRHQDAAFGLAEAKDRQRDALITTIIDRVIAEAIPAVKEQP